MDIAGVTKLMEVNVEERVMWTELACALKVVNCLLRVSLDFAANSSAEICVAIEGLVVDNAIEVSNGLGVHVGHLVDLCALVPLDRYMRTAGDTL